MSKPKTHWIRLRKDFNPYEILTGERAKLYCDREHNPLDYMMQAFDPDEQAGLPKIFFTGHLGSGKSSTLYKFSNHFTSSYFVVHFNAADNIDLAKVNRLDVLYLLGAALFKAGLQENVGLEDRMLKELGQTLETISTTEKQKPEQSIDWVELAKGVLVLTAGTLGTPFAGKLAEALLKPIKLSANISTETAHSRTIEPQVQEVVAKINEIIGQIEALTGKQVLLVVDDLDKITDLGRAKALFVEDRKLIDGPQCRIVYTVPISIYRELEADAPSTNYQVYCLPNIKLYHESDRCVPYETGYQEMRLVVKTRLDALGLTEADVFAPAVVDHLILKSGGVMRILIQFVQNATRTAQLQEADLVDEQTAEVAIGDEIARMTSQLRREYVTELKEVYRTRRITKSPECGELLKNMFILAYRNTITWYDVHPLLWKTIELES